MPQPTDSGRCRRPVSAAQDGRPCQLPARRRCGRSPRRGRSPHGRSWPTPGQTVRRSCRAGNPSHGYIAPSANTPRVATRAAVTRSPPSDVSTRAVMFAAQMCSSETPNFLPGVGANESRLAAPLLELPTLLDAASHVRTMVRASAPSASRSQPFRRPGTLPWHSLDAHERAPRASALTRPPRARCMRAGEG